MSQHPTRRRLLAGATLAAVGALAGCTGESNDQSTDGTPSNDGSDAEVEGAPALPRVENPPDAVYKPTHREAMRHLPPVDAGEYTLSPMVTYPHSFWLVTGTEREEVTPTDGRGVHLMATLWDRETGQVLPVDSGTEMRVLRDGEVVDQRAPWPMISQTMGFHFGDNVPLPEDGTYTVEVDINPITVRKTGAFEGRFEGSETARFEFEYDDEFRQAVIGGVEYLDESEWGQRGALEPPMGMAHGNGHGDGSDHEHENGHHDDGHEHHDDEREHHDDEREHHMPFSALPMADSYPGDELGEHESGDARFVVRYLSDSRFAEGGYLLVSPRTPYNRVPLADMALSTQGAVESELEQILDSEVGLHYGTPAELSGGDSFELVVDGPPQVSRHAGYETAFLEMPSMTVEVPE